MSELVDVEEWRSVLDYEGLYEICSDGRVRNARNYHVLSESVDDNGYPKVFLSKPGQKWAKGHRVHRILARVFIPGEAPGLEVRHLNDVKTDYRLENLKWGTRSENIQDQVRNGLHNMASRTRCPKGHRLSGDNLGWNDGRRTCRTCMRAARNADRRRTQEMGLPDGDPRHGTLHGHHDFKCRCEPCKEACRVYRREYRARRKQMGLPNA